MLTTILRYAVPVSFIFSFCLLTIQTLRTSRFGKPRLYSEGAGDPKKGVIYSFGKGMMPWEKESARKHLPTYIAGMVYHAGIFSALGWCFSLVFRISLPDFVVFVLQVCMAVGFILGLGLLIKRIVNLPVHAISFPDDYVSNIVVDFFLLTGLLASRWNEAVPAFFVVSIITFLYMPMGKIRHCFFFFYSRFLFGRYFGRRGVFPHTPTGR